MRKHIRFVISLFIIILSVSDMGAARRKRQPVDTVGLGCRGVMECFPKVADGIVERLDFYKAEGLTHYFYCPSDDRYCSRWGWKFLYNDNERHEVRNLNSLCAKAGLRFVWTVKPGERYAWTDSDYKFLLDKLVMMYHNGLRAFAVDFTDNPGDHAALKDSLMRDFVATRKEKISLYVIDDIPAVRYPSEGRTAVETMMRGYHFDKDFISAAKKSEAVICNLSSSDEFAKLAVIAVAGFAGNPYAYSPDDSMADAINILNGDVREAFLTFLRHTGGVEESSAAEVFSLNDWTVEKAESLYAEFDRIEQVPHTMERVTGSATVNELKPWLEEFGRLGTRGKRVLECMEYYAKGDIGSFWVNYLKTIMTQDQKESYSACPVGATKLHPFCMTSVSDMLSGFSAMLTGESQLHNLASTLYSAPGAALDSDFSTSVNSAGYADFVIPAHANTCHLLTGPLPEGERIIFRQFGTDGSLLAEFVVKSPFTTFDLKNGAVKVDVLGDVDIYETIFVDLQL